MENVKKESRIRHFLDPILKTNPLFVLVLGCCPALAVTTSLESAIGMGILFTFVLFFSNLIISALRKIIPEEVKTPAYIVVIATFVTIVKLLSEAFLPELYKSLGVFVSLLVVNCIVLGRAEAFASEHGVVDSMLDGLGNGVGFTVRQVIDEAKKVTGVDIKVVEEGRRAGDPATLIASSEKAKSVLGWKPEYADLSKIIETAWKWHSEHKNGFED